MAYVNLPNSLNQMFNDLDERISRIETGYNGPMQYASSAQSTAITASSSAATAAAGAAAAQAIAATAIQKDSYNIFNASNQLTAINGNGITVYAGSSPTTGARVVLNSNGLTGTDGSTTTFAINASTGNVSLTGALVTGGSISGSSISIGGGNFSVTSGGVLNAISGSVAGWTLNSSYFTDGSTTFLKPLSTSTQFSILTGAGISASSVVVGTGVVPIINGGTGYSFSVGGTSFFTGAVSTSGQVTVGGNLQVQSMSSTSATGVVWSSSNSRFYLTTSTERHKDNITPIPAADYLSKLLELQPVTFNYKPEFTDNPNQLISGLIAEKVAAIPEFSTVVNLDAEGQPESLAYDRLAVFILPALKQLNDRLTALEAK